MQMFKLSVFWTAWTPQVATRILRDVLDLQRLCRTNRVQLIVASDSLLAPKVRALGVEHLDSLVDADLARVYVAPGTSVEPELNDRLPSDNLEYVNLEGITPPPSSLVIETDPYAGVDFYKDWHRIPETMPLDQKPPPQNGEPLMSPFL